MSAQWSLTYLNPKIEVDSLFDQLVEAFKQNIVGKLHHTNWVSENHPEILLDDIMVEKFQEVRRANLIFESCEVGVYNRGVILYPEREGLFTIYDSINLLDAVWMADRIQRGELLAQQASNPQTPVHAMFLYNNLLCDLTKKLQCDAVHVLFERNPAGHVTAVQFISKGGYIDDFFHGYIDGGEWEQLEMPEHPQQVQRSLDGRFAFLLNQPKKYISPIDHEEYEEYFDAQQLKPRDPKWDVFNIQAQRLYVPFWDENFLPYGAAYCPAQELPSPLA